MSAKDSSAYGQKASECPPSPMKGASVAPIDTALAEVVRPRTKGMTITTHVIISPKTIRLTSTTKTPKRSKGTNALRKICNHARVAAIATITRTSTFAFASCGSSALTSVKQTKSTEAINTQLSMRPSSQSCIRLLRAPFERRRFLQCR